VDVLTRKEVVITVVGILLFFAGLGAVFMGAVGYEQDDESLVFSANLGLGALGYAFVAWIGYIESDWRLWTVPHAVGFAIAGSVFTVIAFVAPWSTGWIFALIAELI
jgi:hypothetical protein